MSRSILENLVEFGRAARAAGLPVTTGQIEDLAQALGWVGIDDRDRVFRVARALLVCRREDLALFETLFNWFWRAPEEEACDPPRTMPRAPRHKPAEARFTIATYMAFKARQGLPEVDVGDRSGAFTDQEVLQRKRFVEMTPDELDAVSRLIREMRWGVALRVTRRYVGDDAGRQIDFRRVLTQASRLGAVPARLPRRRRVVKPRPLVLLADVSGSMEKYSRLVLQFFHAMVSTMPNVETFLFGTRLTRVTSQLRVRNIDRALDEAAREVADWAGGTRIGACLGTFNRSWSRRVLRRGAVVVVISDGCDTEGAEELGRQMRYLQHRCHRLVWLNPHLGNERYEARAAGMAAALPFVDDFLPVHNIQSLSEFARVLARIPASGRSARRHSTAVDRGVSSARQRHARV